MDTITLKKYRNIFGFPVKDYYLKLGFDLKNEPFEKSGLEFIKEYENRRYDAQLFPQVIPLLIGLRTKGISHSILSAQHQTLLDDLTQYYNIRDYFIGVIGLDNHYAHSKEKNGIELMNRINLSPEEIIIIGDTDHDFDVAEAIGVDCLLLSHGHYSFKRLKKTGAKVVKNLIDIFSFFKIELTDIK